MYGEWRWIYKYIQGGTIDNTCQSHTGAYGVATSDVFVNSRFFGSSSNSSAKLQSLRCHIQCIETSVQHLPERTHVMHPKMHFRNRKQLVWQPKCGYLRNHTIKTAHLPDTNSKWSLSSLSPAATAANSTQPINEFSSIAENVQVALLWQRDRATRMSVEILQLQYLPIWKLEFQVYRMALLVCSYV